MTEPVLGGVMHEQAGAPVFLQNARLFAADAEFTHLNKQLRRIWEWAHIPLEVNGRQLVAGKPFVVQVQLTPEEIDQAHPVSLEIGRFHQRRAQWPTLYEPEDLAKALEKQLAGRQWLGAVPNGDSEPLEELMRRHGGLIPTWDYHLVCVEVLAAGWLGRYGYPWDDLLRDPSPMIPYRTLHHRRIVELLEKETGREIAVPEDEKHTAMGDAWEVARMFAALFDLTIVSAK